MSILVPWVVTAPAYGAIDEVIVTAAPTEDRVFPPSVQLDHEALQELQPVATADVFRNLTGVAMRTNSRGESVIRIRGAEERQTLVFLDGAPLATPWDGRTDLALLPAGLIDRIEVTRGAVPIEYGANAVAGAVDLFTYMPEPGSELRAELQRGSLGIANLNAVAGLGLENGWSFVGGASRIERDAERIADRSSVVFDPSTTSERTNTDMSGTSGYLAAGYTGESFNVHASLLHADVDRGVAAPPAPPSTSSAESAPASPAAAGSGSAVPTAVAACSTPTSARKAARSSSLSGSAADGGGSSGGLTAVEAAFSGRCPAPR